MLIFIHLVVYASVSARQKQEREIQHGGHIEKSSRGAPDKK